MTTASPPKSPTCIIGKLDKMDLDSALDRSLSVCAHPGDPFLAAVLPGYVYTYISCVYVLY